MLTHLVDSQLNQTYYSRNASTAESGQDVIFTQSTQRTDWKGSCQI